MALLLFLALLTVACRAARFRGASNEELALIPYPSKVEVAAGKAPFQLKKETAVDLGEGIPKDDLVATALRDLLSKVGAEGKGEKPITLRLDTKASGGAEGYSMHVDENKVDLKAATLTGLFYGVQTLKQLAKTEQGKAELPAVVIEDSPRFQWRGLHLDVSRHFFGAKEVKKLISTMAQFKLNRFHWHLTDDQGWRLPIDGLPKLTEIGSEGVGGRRAYTKEEIKDVVAHAKASYVDIMPEIEVPGHAAAALAAYPALGNTDAKGWQAPSKPWDQWGVSEHTLAPSNATWVALGKVFDTVAELFPGKFVHLGGDEAETTEWSDSKSAMSLIKNGNPSKVQAVFNTKVCELLKAKGRRAAGWNEALSVGGMSNNSVILGWQGEDAVTEAVKAGMHTVNSNQDKLYFDHYQADPEHEPKAFGGLTQLDDVYAYDPMPEGLSEDQQKFVLGAQGQLWSEYFPTWKQVEYMAFPRALALAEITWTPKDHRSDFNDFKSRLGTRLKDLESAGVNYKKL